MKFFHPPGSSVTLAAYSPNMIPNSEVNYTNQEYIINNEYFLSFGITFRECAIGEIYREKSNMYLFEILFCFFSQFFYFLIIIKSCQECPEGKYSLADPMNTTDCFTCPQNANTCYKAKIFLKPSNFDLFLNFFL